MKRIKNIKLYSFKETIKKSIFITIIEVINSNDELEKAINKHFDKEATHNVYAYSFLENGLLFKSFKDDGEPHGTAGKPILNIIEKQEIQNILVFVKRYYGGIKLGPGGLSRAYCNGFINLLSNEIELKDIEELNHISASYHISNNKKVNSFINSLMPIDLNVEYIDNICNVCFYTNNKNVDIKSISSLFIEINAVLKKR